MAADETTTALPPSPMAVTRADTTAHDDWVRFVLAIIISLQFTLVVGGISVSLIYAAMSNIKIGSDILAVLIMVVQGELAILTATWFYYYGSSSGSTAKGVAAEKRAG